MVFSVMLSMVKSFIGGTLAFEGSILEVERLLWVFVNMFDVLGEIRREELTDFFSSS